MGFSGTISCGGLFTLYRAKRPPVPVSFVCVSSWHDNRKGETREEGIVPDSLQPIKRAKFVPLEFIQRIRRRRSTSSALDDFHSFI